MLLRLSENTISPMSSMNSSFNVFTPNAAVSESSRQMPAYDFKDEAIPFITVASDGSR